MKQANNNFRYLIISLLLAVLLVCVGFYFKGITGNVALATYLDTNYSAPYNLSNPDDYFFKISDSDLVAIDDVINLSVNVSVDGYIYQKGYVYNQLTKSWEVFNFNQTPVENSYWIENFASKDLVINVSNRIVNNSETYIVAYACQKDSDGKWQCGCQSEGETNCKRWMLHKFDITNITISPDINCTDDANCSMTNGTCIAGLCVSKTKNPFPLGTPGNPFKIYNWTGLNNTRNNLTASYILMNNLNGSMSDYLGLGNNWQPIGASYEFPFNGSFNGDNNTISDLIIYLPSNYYVGLFGYLAGNVSNIGLIEVNVTGNSYVGGLMGRSRGIVSNSYATGNVTGKHTVGGLGGACSLGGITNSYSMGRVSATNTDSYAGGLVGFHFTGTISNSYSNVNVSGNNYIGGLVGQQGSNYVATIQNSYSIGTVIGGYWVGGLVGYANPRSIILNSYSTANVNGYWDIGGLVGDLDTGAILSNSYAAGSVSGSSYVGGFAGINRGAIMTGLYWYNRSQGLNCWLNDQDIGYNVGCTSITNPDYFFNYENAPMNLTSGTGWDFTNVWSNVGNGSDYPKFKWQTF